MSVFELKDTKITPDIIQEYTEPLKGSHTAIIIDNGSYQCRVGWSTQSNPSMVFKNLIAKPRKDRSKKENSQETVTASPTIQIGNDIVNIEALRFQLRTQFDRNVVTHFHIQEQIFDYIFSHLGIDSEGRVDHPVVMTECFANPNYCRNLMSELLFECYDVPAVCYGVDSLFSFRNNGFDNGLIISCGFQTTHVIPVLNGQVCADKTRRINLGGYHMTYYLHRLLQLKYPVHVNAVTLSRVEKLLHEHCSIANDYMAELRKWAKLEFYEEHVKKVQLPFTPITIAPILSAEQKFEKKRELARRLVEINNRKREEKLAEDEDLVQRLLIAQELFADGNLEEYEFTLKEYNLTNFEELEKMIVAVRTRIERTKHKMLLATDSSNMTIPEDKPPNIPAPPDGLSADEWVLETKRKRTALLDRRQQRRQRKQDLAKRRTAAAQERMRIISQLARKEKGTDDFGMRDEDWDIYKAISREGGDSDSDVENEKLIEFEEVLRHHDPTFEEPQAIQGAAESYQLHVGVEAIRTLELLFQPSMIGSSEAGLAGTIDYVLNLFPPETQLTLANNVFLTGGCSRFTGLEVRLSREMLEMRPFQTPHKITVAKDASLDAWHGAREFTDSEELPKYLITKELYNEMGGDYLAEHSASNEYCPTPAPIVTAETVANVSI